MSTYGSALYGSALYGDSRVAVAGGGVTLSADLFRCTVDNTRVEDLSDLLIGGEVELNIDRAIKLAARFTVRAPERIAPYTDYLAPFLRLEHDDGAATTYEQVGLFAVPVAPRTAGLDDAVGTFEGRDLTWVLATSIHTDSVTRAAGQNYGTTIAAAITGAGLSRYSLPETSETLPTAQTFPVGMSRLERANKQLDQLGWYHLGMALDGTITTPGAPQDLASQEPWRTLTEDDLLARVEVQPAGQEIANVVIVVNNDAASAPRSAVARNDDPASPTSTVAIGREIARVETVTGSTTTAALTALAARLLAESRTFYQTAKLRLLHDPSALIPHQTVQLTLGGDLAALSGRWWIRTARLGLTPGQSLELECNRVTDDLNGAAI